MLLRQIYDTEICCAVQVVEYVEDMGLEPLHENRNGFALDDDDELLDREVIYVEADMFYELPGFSKPYPVLVIEVR